ncbi:hypothetical protein BH10PSE19_BH10PSE19_04650 [soil metagenome]
MIQPIIPENPLLIKEITITWTSEDIKEVRPDLSDVQASKVLQYVDRKHDDNVGINWEVIEIVADDLFPTTAANIAGEGDKC